MEQADPGGTGTAAEAALPQIPEEHLAWLEQDLEIMLRNQKKQTEESLHDKNTVGTGQAVQRASILTPLFTAGLKW
ncbi:MAG: hypothetical protein V8Q30_11590 [Acutalibacteraceae bacterium]